MSDFSYYDKSVNPIDFDAFAALKYDADGNVSAYARIGLDRIDDSVSAYARIGLDRIDDSVEVSTVWLGLNHAFMPGGPPLIFETLIFGGRHDGELQRYSTESEALAGHLHAINELRAGRSPW